jgi:hypothetical protein
MNSLQSFRSLTTFSSYMSMFYIFLCTDRLWILIQPKHVTVDILDTISRVEELFVGFIKIIVILRGL